MTPEEQFADIREMIAAQVEIGRRTDARLESIAERHAVLAQSVELLTHAQRDTEAFLREHFAQMAGAIQRLALPYQS